jgi:hypothetical protein
VSVKYQEVSILLKQIVQPVGLPTLYQCILASEIKALLIEKDI